MNKSNQVTETKENKGKMIYLIGFLSFAAMVSAYWGYTHEKLTEPQFNQQTQAQHDPVDHS